MNKSKNKRESRLWTEDYSCPCCDMFWPDWVEQQLKLDWDDADALNRDLREAMKEGFARFAYPLLGRLLELEPDSRRVSRVSCLRIKQLNAGERNMREKCIQN